jgi:hypothetical protein
MAWWIDKDLVDGGESIGKWNAYFRNPNSGLEVVKRICKFKFRMFDDDGVLYYEGYSNDNNGEKAFDPLDDFGLPNAGCTDIKYKNKLGRWESL